MLVLIAAKAMSSDLPTTRDIQKLRPSLIREAQRLYNRWKASNGSGLCDEIAGKFDDIFERHGVEYMLCNKHYDQREGRHHAFHVVKLDTGVYIVDLPFEVYEWQDKSQDDEQGYGGWKKNRRCEI
jgi:hypothetical protein